MEYLKRTWAEISIPALQSNIRKIQSHLSKKSEIMGVVKADAYGHGVEVVTHTLWNMGVKYFAVSNLIEAIEVRKICPESDILILGYTPPENAQLLEQYNIIQAVVSVNYAQILSASSRGKIRCHVKLDTGMGRIGLKNETPEQSAKEVEYISKLEHICVEGIFTHFAVADTDTPECNEYTQMQQDFITETAKIVKEDGFDLKHVHFMNSAASISHTTDQSTLARTGIIMYGLLPNYPQELSIKFEPVMSLYSTVSYVKTVPAGTSVSYGRTYITDKERTIATVTVGYADGYPRLLSNKGWVLIHGVKCPVVGRICMDQIMVDVSDVDVTVKPNDVVTLIGRDGNEEITADELASSIGTIGYEIVCGITKRVPRTIKYDI